MWLHILPNAINPVVSLIGLQLGRLMGGAVVVESIFAWPGLGLTIIQAIERQDLILLQATVFTVAIIAVGVNLLLDVAHKAIDPRIEYG